VTITINPPVDGTAPTVTLGALQLEADKTYKSAISLSVAAGNCTAFDLADLTVANGTVALSGSGTGFTATVTPDRPGVSPSLSVAEGAFTDAAGNPSAASNVVTIRTSTRLAGPAESRFVSTHPAEPAPTMM
jgi:hypothetical protein